jgi:hypothetical protein
MTTASSAVAAYGVAAENRPAWPAGDTVVLRSRTIQAGTPDDRLSRFSDAVWVLQPAHADAHHVVNSVHCRGSRRLWSCRSRRSRWRSLTTPTPRPGGRAGR